MVRDTSFHYQILVDIKRLLQVAFLFYRLSFISTVHHIHKKKFQIVHSVLIICLYLCMSKQKNMKTKKAFIAKNRVYPTKDAAILCTGSKDVTVVNIREDYKFMSFEAELYYEDDILLIDPYCHSDIIVWNEQIEFKYVNGEFQQMFKEVELSIKDLSQELQDEIWQLVKESICSTCNGTGVVEVMRCTNGSNECCGGCYYEEQCEDCNK